MEVDRLGSGSQSEISARNYERSSHDLSYIWRSSMACGTLVPFMSELALPGDSWDIDLNCDVKKLPTIGPLFGSYKVQLDVFECPIRLYQGKLHMNMLNIGMDMKSIKLPQLEILGEYNPDDLTDNSQINASSIYSYLNMRGLGRTSTGIKRDVKRQFNAVPYLGYWDIYKNYYANLQEEGLDKVNGYVIHAVSPNNEWTIDDTIVPSELRLNGNDEGSVTDGNTTTLPTFSGVDYVSLILPAFWAPNTGPQEGEADPYDVTITINGTDYPLVGPGGAFNQYSVIAGPIASTITASDYNGPTGTGVTFTIAQTEIKNTLVPGTGAPQLYAFDLDKIDEMREELLMAVQDTAAYVIDYTSLAPYGLGLDTWDGAATGDWDKTFCKSSQEGLGIKTYQSDLLNNWISTEWIDGPNGVGEVRAVLVTPNQSGDDVIYMDSLNLQQKVYNMLNRIAVSGGSYDDWLDAVYTHERAKSKESPVYHGSLIKELAFEEVVSTTDTLDIAANVDQPLGTLAGRGKLTGKHKGGKIRIKIDEPSYILGIVSITPRVDYSQGNKWDVNLKTMDDFYKPELGQIGYQDLVTGQMAWWGDITNSLGEVEHESAGKQPAWINYMTNLNQCRGHFADENNSMFMTLNRRYQQETDGIGDITTYIDPTHYNQIFADTSLDAQNFWVQIGNRITARRKMSAKTIPNL